MLDSSSPVTLVSPEEEQTVLPDLITLLQVTVAGGASVGFLPPLSTEDARLYWLSVIKEVSQRTCMLLVARDAGHIVGSVQLGLATKANAQHRAEVQKLFVHPQQRRKGIGRTLMEAVEQIAREAGRSLLVLDTREGDAAAQLYRLLEYCEVGVIPHYARSATGTLDNTIYFYKELQI